MPSKSREDWTHRDVRYLMNSGKYVEVTGDKKRQMTQVEAHELNKKKSMMNDGTYCSNSRSSISLIQLLNRETT